LASLGRGLRDNAALISTLAVIIGALITALLTLVGVVIAQFVTVTLEDNRAREAELQTYLDDIGQMLLNEDNPLLEAEPDATLSSIARAKTLAILERIDPQQKRTALGFLNDSR
jgi:predicted PurR-regulated permease PerM